jgi:signal transduction histidine kinase
MGLGLAVAKAMVELHNGQIWVESVEGKGSNFSFLLPLLEMDSTGRTPAFVAGVKPFE